MKAAALLALLVALPARSSDGVTPAQARTNVVSALGLPPELSKGAATGNLQQYLAGLSPEQKKAALRSLQERGGELGKDPATLAVMGQAYAGLGKIEEARQAALQIQRERPNDPEAARILGWVRSQEKLAPREGGGGPETPAGAPAGGRVSPAAAGSRPTNPLEARLQSLFQRGKNSPEFNSTMSEARGMSIAQLKEAGISFSHAAADQKDAVMITEHSDGTFTVALRKDALESGGDREARAAAHLANGVRQAQTLRDNNEFVGWVKVKARGWFTGAQTHKELAPNDIDRNPDSRNPSDQNLMAARKILEQKGDPKEGVLAKPFVPGKESYGNDAENGALRELNSMSEHFELDFLFQQFMKLTKRGFGP